MLYVIYIFLKQKRNKANLNKTWNAEERFISKELSVTTVKTNKRRKY